MPEKYRVEIQLPTSQDTLRFGEIISRFLTPNLNLYLQGDLGMGKTTVTKGILAGLGFNGLVKSPTYTLVETYTIHTGDVHHLDLYRLEEPESLEFMGIRTYFGDNAIRLIEWPEMGRHYIPKPDLHINLTINSKNQDPAKSGKLTRTAELCGVSQSIQTQWDAITHELACFNTQ